MKPVYLGPVAGISHPPHGDPSGLGVLLVPPFGWDDQSFFRPRRAWARALAEAGHAVLRIDLPGTGDSAGGPADADLVAAWRAAVADAVAWLGTERTAIVAVGLGGLLSLGVPVDALVAWGAPARGRSFLRELKAFGRLEASQTGETPSDGPGLHAGGHLLSAQTVSALSALDAADLLAGAAPRRALLLGRDGVDPDARLVQALREAGTEVETGPGRGWGDAAAGPQFATVPDAVIAASLAFLGEPSAPASTDERAAASTLDLAGARETPLRVGAAYGVVCEPEGERADVTAVLLNAGAIRHIGPNRMWVEAARRWAAQGVPTLRVDLEAIGEADGADTAYGDDAAFYTPELTAQVAPVLDALADRGLPPRFLLAGLCSGGYWAVHAADADPRVAAAVLLNPRLVFWDEEAGERHELRRALSVVTPKGFRALLRAERPIARGLAVLRYALSRPFRPRRPAPPPQAVRELVQRLAARGQHVEFAFSGEEPLRDELERSGEAAHLPIHPLPLRSHTLKPLEAQRAAHAVLDAALARARRA